jgi:hypothetical protein
VCPAEHLLKEDIMSRVTTPPQTQSYGSTVHVPREKIAMRAYEKWQKRGCSHGNDLQDWVEAENELRQELARSSGSSFGGNTGTLGTRR